MKNFLDVALKNIKLLLTVDPYNYRLTILRLLTFFGFIFGMGQYIVLNLMNSFDKNYSERSFLVQIDFFAAILVLTGGAILFKQVKRGAVEIASHILIVLLLIIAVRVESTLGRLEVSMTVMTLAIITAGVIIKPTMSILYGVISVAALYLLDITELNSAARVSILLTLFTAIFLAYLISRVITDSFNRNKDQNEKLRTHVAEKRNVEGLLMRRNRELKILNSIGKALNSTLDVDEILSSMLKELIEQREVYSASVWLVDEKSGKNICRQISGPNKDAEILRGMELEPGRGIVGKAIAMGEVVKVDDTAVDPNHLKNVALMIGAEIRSILSVPIKYRGKCLGTIQLVHQEVNYFNEEDVETAKAIANMAATALEKATLHNEVKTQLSKVKRFGDALKQSDYKFRILAESTTTGIVLIQNELPVYVNPAIISMLGYTYDEIYSTNFIKFLAPESIPEVAKIFQSVLQEKRGPIKYEALVYAKDGSGVWGDCSVDLIELDGVPTFIGTFSDITRYKETQSQLEKASEVAQESLRSKQEFLANIGHEIRTPLNALIGMAELLGEEVSEKDRKEYLGIIKSSTNNLLGTINDLLDFTKIESGKLKLRDEVIDLKETVEEVRGMMIFGADSKDLDFKVELGDSLPAFVIGDQLRLKQMLINLVENAIKFTSKGFVRLRVNSGVPKDGNIELIFEVEDSGRGVPKDMQDKIFETFEQVRVKKERISKGIGLGLSIVKSLVDAHKGKISLQSKEGKGSKFTIRIEYRIATKPQKQAKIDKKLPLVEERVINVLLVDDNKVNQIVATKILSRANMKIFLASKGSEAIEFLVEGKNSVDIVLLDLELPDISGFKVASEIRKNRNPSIAHLPIIALTAHALEDVKTEVLEAGMDDYITKPFIPEVLINTISKRFKGLVKARNVDLSYLISATNNDGPLMKEMIEQFFIQMDDVLMQIDQAIEEGNSKEIAALVHQIKPSIAYMGITRLKESINDFALLVQSEKPDFSMISSSYSLIKRHYSESVYELKDFQNRLV